MTECYNFSLLSPVSFFVTATYTYKLHFFFTSNSNQDKSISFELRKHNTSLDKSRDRIPKKDPLDTKDMGNGYIPRPQKEKEKYGSVSPSDATTISPFTSRDLARGNYFKNLQLQLKLHIHILQTTIYNTPVVGLAL